MSDSIKPMSSDFFRQRRSLMILSGIFIFLKYSEIEIKKFTMFGIEFSDFRNPNAIYMALWIFWFYYMIRYYQHFAQEGLNKIKTTFINIIDEKSVKKINEIVKRKYPNNQRDNVTFSILRKWSWVYSGQYDDIGPNGLAGLNIKSFKMEIKKTSLLPVMINGIACLVLQRSVLTDYLLPIVMAIFTLIYCGNGWEGSLIDNVKLIFI